MENLMCIKHGPSYLNRPVIQDPTDMITLKAFKPRNQVSSGRTPVGDYKPLVDWCIGRMEKWDPNSKGSFTSIKDFEKTILVTYSNAKQYLFKGTPHGSNNIYQCIHKQKRTISDR